MNQEEFESRLSEMKAQKKEAIQQLIKMQLEAKEEGASLKRQIGQLCAQKEKLNQQMAYLGTKRIEVEKSWREKIKKFYEENHTQTRKLEEVSDWALINELSHRGFSGNICNIDKPEDYLKDLNAKLNASVLDKMDF